MVVSTHFCHYASNRPSTAETSKHWLHTRSWNMSWLFLSLLNMFNPIINSVKIARTIRIENYVSPVRLPPKYIAQNDKWHDSLTFRARASIAIRFGSYVPKRLCVLCVLCVFNATMVCDSFRSRRIRYRSIPYIRYKNRVDALVSTLVYWVLLDVRFGELHADNGDGMNSDNGMCVDTYQQVDVMKVATKSNTTKQSSRNSEWSRVEGVECEQLIITWTYAFDWVRRPEFQQQTQKSCRTFCLNPFVQNIDRIMSIDA